MSTTHKHSIEVTKSVDIVTTRADPATRQSKVNGTSRYGEPDQVSDNVSRAYKGKTRPYKGSVVKVKKARTGDKCGSQVKPSKCKSQYPYQ